MQSRCFTFTRAYGLCALPLVHIVGTRECVCTFGGTTNGIASLKNEVKRDEITRTARYIIGLAICRDLTFISWIQKKEAKPKSADRILATIDDSGTETLWAYAHDSRMLCRADTKECGKRRTACMCECIAIDTKMNGKRTTTTDRIAEMEERNRSSKVIVTFFIPFLCVFVSIRRRRKATNRKLSERRIWNACVVCPPVHVDVDALFNILDPHPQHRMSIILYTQHIHAHTDWPRFDNIMILTQYEVDCTVKLISWRARVHNHKFATALEHQVDDVYYILCYVNFMANEQHTQNTRFIVPIFG